MARHRANFFFPLKCHFPWLSYVKLIIRHKPRWYAREGPVANKQSSIGVDGRISFHYFSWMFHHQNIYAFNSSPTTPLFIEWIFSTLALATSFNFITISFITKWSGAGDTFTISLSKLQLAKINIHTLSSSIILTIVFMPSALLPTTFPPEHPFMTRARLFTCRALMNFLWLWIYFFMSMMNEEKKAFARAVLWCRFQFCFYFWASLWVPEV